jgi:1-acyl-sn-glycerol-3-phosphate acyltransferase
MPERLSYRVLRAWARSAVSVFYRSVEVTNASAIPRDRPVILAVNHQSALGDVAVLVAVRPKLPHFLAASSWWKRASARALFRLGGVVPVYRNSDGHGTRANVSTFAACHAALAAGAQLAIFPEGEMHADGGVHPLKTGAARIALGAATEAGVQRLVIVPVALIYDDMGRFRSDAEVRIGEPIEIDDWIDAYRLDRHKAVRALTHALRDALADAAVDGATARADLVDRAARMALSDTPSSFADRNALRRALRSESGDRFDELERAVREHARHLDTLMLDDDAPLEPLPDATLTRAARDLALLAGPAAVGAIVNGPAVLAAWGVSTRAPDEGWHATAKGVAGTFLLPITWIGEWALLSRRRGRRRAGAIVLLGAACGGASLAWHDRYQRFRRARRSDALNRDRAADMVAARETRAVVRKHVDAITGDDR